MTTTPCYLTVLQHLTDEQVDYLMPLLTDMKPADPYPREALLENSVLIFQRVFDGDMPLDLLRWFSNNKVSFTWEWEGFDQVGAGTNFFDAENDEILTFRLHENLAVIPVTQANDAEKVQKLHDAIVRVNFLRHCVGIT